MPDATLMFGRYDSEQRRLDLHIPHIFYLVLEVRILISTKTNKINILFQRLIG